MNRFNTCISAACLFAVAGSAMAQLATPPTKAKPDTPEYVAPAPKPVATPPSDPSRNQPSLTNPTQRGKIPDVPYRKLAQLGPDGKIIRFDVPMDYEALRNNPTVGVSKTQAIMPLLIGRRYRMEQIVIDNLDFVEQVENGLLENMSLTNTDEMKKITDVLTPLVPPKGVTQELFDRNLLSRTQKDINLKIMGEYQNAIMAEYTAEDTNTGLTNFMGFIMGESVKEANMAYDGMLGEATWRMKEVLEKAGLENASAAGALLAITGSPDDEPDVFAAKAALVREAWDSLDLGQKQAFLRAVRETRDDELQPPVRTIDLANPDLIDQTGTGTGLEVRTRRGPGSKPASDGEGGGD